MAGIIRKYLIIEKASQFFSLRCKWICGGLIWIPPVLQGLVLGSILLGHISIKSDSFLYSLFFLEESNSWGGWGRDRDSGYRPERSHRPTLMTSQETVPGSPRIQWKRRIALRITLPSHFKYMYILENATTVTRDSWRSRSPGHAVVPENTMDDKGWVVLSKTDHEKMIHELSKVLSSQCPTGIRRFKRPQGHCLLQNNFADLCHLLSSNRYVLPLSTNQYKSIAQLFERNVRHNSIYTLMTASGEVFIEPIFVIFVFFHSLV